MPYEVRLFSFHHDTRKITGNKADALTRRPCREECVQCHKVEAREDIAQVRAITAVAAAGWDTATLRTDHLNDPDIGPILREIETGQRPQLKDISDRNPTSKVTGLSGSRSLWDMAY
jgi:hypothetical protein